MSIGGPMRIVRSRYSFWMLLLGVGGCGTPFTLDTGVSPADVPMADIPTADMTVRDVVVVERDIPSVNDVPDRMDAVVRDVPSPRDSDVGPTEDVVSDVSDGRADVAEDSETDAWVGQLCLRVPVENLNLLGTQVGDTLRYVGDNNGANSNTNVGLQTTANIQNLAGCAFRTAYQRVFAYTATSEAVLRVSTSNPMTVRGFDTTILVASSCPAGALDRALLGCNDDDLAADGDQRRQTSAVLTVRKVARGTTVLIAVGGFVPVVGARNAAIERGVMELTVQEIPVLPLNAVCDPTRRTNACDTGSTCVGASINAPTGRCLADGSAPGTACALNGSCIGANILCDANSMCVQNQTPDGMVCDPYHLCAASSTCVNLQLGLTQGICRANGSVVGANCAGAPLSCAAGLQCSLQPGGLDGTCLRSVPIGGCSTYDNACPAGQDCVGPGNGGRFGNCNALGAALGGECAAGRVCSGAGLRCTMSGAYCERQRNVGESCGVFDTCAMNGRCFLTDLQNRWQGQCFAEGARGGPCRAGGACDAGLTCSDLANPANGRCVTVVALGGACDLTAVCSGDDSCVRTSPPNMPFAGACRARGTAGARCRDGVMPCDAALSCSSLYTSDGICQSNAMGACDPRYATNRCAMGQVCRASALDVGSCAATIVETEPNDLVSPMLAPTATPNVVLGALTFADVDCYALSVGAMGRVFAQASTANGLCPANLALDLYRMDGSALRLLGSDFNSGPYGCPRIEGADIAGNFAWAATLSAGTYYVCLRNSSAGREPVSSYALSLGTGP